MPSLELLNQNNRICTDRLHVVEELADIELTLS